MPSKSRRRLLQLGSVSLVSGLAGCVGSVYECGRLFGAKMHKVSIEPDEVTLSSEQQSSIVPIKFAELPSKEQEIVRKSIRDGEYAVCYPGSEALQSFIDRVETNQRKQYNSYDGENPPKILSTAFLKYRSRYYSLYVNVEDTTVSPEYVPTT